MTHRTQIRILVLFTVAWTAQAAQLVAAPNNWAVHRQHGHLEFFSEYPIDTTAFAAQLAEVADELQATFGLEQPRLNIQVILFRSPQSYRAYLTSSVPDAAKRRAIFYQNRNVFQIYAYRHAELVTDLRHEYTHAFLHQSLPFVPLWIDEGIAEFMEERPAVRAGSSRVSGMRWRCRTGRQPDLRSLEKLPSASSMSSSDYRDSWAWVHYLVNESPETLQVFKRYLQAISAGEAPGAFSEFADQYDAQVTKQLGSYFRRFRISLR